MRSLDEAHLIHPIYGSRKLVLMLKASGYVVNRKHVQRLMRIMGLESLVPKPNLSKPNKEHPIYPYLLRGMRVIEPNQVWATDITYIPMKAGFVYLVAIIDWFSRRVLSWRISNTMDAIFCLDALAEALDLFAHPKIFNTDQGAQFTSEDFTGMLRQNKIAISMDGKGRCLDNVFVERVWRSLKYEEVYLHAYSDASEARKRIGAYFDFYNIKRPHQSLGYQTPDAFYRGDLLRTAV
jgi:putative transposase